MRILSAIMATLATLTMSLGIAQAASAPARTSDAINALQPLWRPDPADRLDPIQPIRFRHGDVSWLPSLAKQAGWPDHTIGKLTELVLRESGGCPNRIGSSIVDKNCNITGYTKATNKSDSGLLQINGVNYNLERNDRAAVCLAGIACEQAPLLDALTNLKAGFVLFRIAGWDPWTPPPGGW